MKKIIKFPFFQHWFFSRSPHSYSTLIINFNELAVDRQNQANTWRQINQPQRGVRLGQCRWGGEAGYGTQGNAGGTWGRNATGNRVSLVGQRADHQYVEGSSAISGKIENQGEVTRAWAHQLDSNRINQIQNQFLPNQAWWNALQPQCMILLIFSLYCTNLST